jgi:hypothetical protein
MKRQAISSLALLAAAALCAPAASAACHWEWLCNGEGTCKQMPVCDTLYEDPPPRPDMKIPTPPIRMRPHALSQTMGDNISCEHVMRQTKAGNWQWDEACFCSDPAKSKDPDAPMAHIVRCTPPWEK